MGLVDQSIREALRQRSAILDLNKAQRDGHHGIGNRHAFGRGTQTWGRHFMRIPVDDWEKLCAINPALCDKDPRVSSAAMLEFERSDASLPYRVTEDYIGGSGRTIFLGTGGDGSAR